MKFDYLKQKFSPNETNFYLDIILLIAFWFIVEPELTGIAVHEWFSLALGLVIVVHLVLHWKWIVALTKKFLKKLFHSSRLQYVLNLFLLIAFGLIFWSGLMESHSILRFFGLRASSNPIWERLHSQASDLMWLVVGLHLVLDWKWIAKAAKKYVITPLKS